MKTSLRIRAHAKRLGFTDDDLSDLLKAFKIAQVKSRKVHVGALGRIEAAKYLGISTRKLDDLLSADEIPRLKLGRKTLVRLIDLDAFLAQLAEEVVV